MGADRAAPKLLDVVELAVDLPDHNLAIGAVGTVVELLDANTVLVEFADTQGIALAIVPLPISAVALCERGQIDAQADRETLSASFRDAGIVPADKDDPQVGKD